MEQNLFTVPAHIVKQASVLSAVRKLLLCAVRNANVRFLQCRAESPRGWGRWHLSALLIQPCESYIRHINFLHYAAASKKQQVKSGSFEVVNSNILFSRSDDFKWSHQNSKSCHGWGKQDNSPQINLISVYPCCMKRGFCWSQRTSVM